MAIADRMDPPSPDGIPVTNYYPHPHPLSNGLPVARYYSPHPSPEDLSRPEYFQLNQHVQEHQTVGWSSPLAHASHLANKMPDAPAQHQQSHSHVQVPMAVSSPCDIPTTGPGFWPTPGRDREFETYCYQGSSHCSSLPEAYNQSPISPVSWSSPSPTQLPFRQIDDRQQNQVFQPAARMCSPSTNGSSPPHSHHMMTHSMYSHTSHPFVGDDGTAPVHTSPPATCGAAASSMSAHHDLLPTSPSRDTTSMSSDVKSEADDAESCGGRNNNRHLPYSMLIYMALSSDPRCAMTLQEIYQWFLLNTNKNGSGWQNSVRHNLSQNAAFMRRLRRHSGEDGTSPGGSSSKPVYEWALAAFAIEDGGVKSTTKYRKKSTWKSPKGAMLQQRRQQRSVGEASGRVFSGHMGGVATSRRKDRNRMKRHQPVPSSMPSQGYDAVNHVHWGGGIGGASEMDGPGDHKGHFENYEPLTPAMTPEDFRPPMDVGVGVSMAMAGDGGLGAAYSPSPECLDLSSLNIIDVSGVYNEGLVFTSFDFRNLHDQRQ